MQPYFSDQALCLVAERAICCPSSPGSAAEDSELLSISCCGQRHQECKGFSSNWAASRADFLGTSRTRQNQNRACVSSTGPGPQLGLPCNIQGVLSISQGWAEVGSAPSRGTATFELLAAALPSLSTFFPGLGAAGVRCWDWELLSAGGEPGITQVMAVQPQLALSTASFGM